MSPAPLIRYARDYQVPAYERLGWLCRSYYGERGDGYHCFLMAWLCACKPVEPR